VVFRFLILFLILGFVLQIQHPRSNLNRFDLVITPHHDYYPLTPHAQEQVPRFLRKWITPREPPDRHVVCIMTIHCLQKYNLFQKLLSYFNISLVYFCVVSLC
jgi:mitochondrial fission protein ELM1